MTSEPDVGVLVIDLDGTLLMSDMLHESFWSALGNNWVNLFSSIKALIRGKAALKEHLALKANTNVSLLPYNNEVLNYAREYSKSGGRVALVTASDQSWAKEISEHLRLFDEAHGSDGVINLNGENKRKFLVEHFGHGSFQYMGNSWADVPVWQASRKIITVGASRAVQEKCETLGKEVLHLQTARPKIYEYLSALRPHQWLKNMLIILPMLAAHQFDTTTTVLTLLALAAFSLIASAVYVLNDLLDLNSDREHPRKRFRPFASGSIAIAHGAIIAPTLLTIGFALASAINLQFFLTLGIYLAVTVLYSLFFKRTIVLDICVLAGLYSVRLIAGSVAAGIELSVWLLAFSTLFFFSLAAVKRQAELVSMKSRLTTKAAGRGYHYDDLPIMSMVALAAGYISILVMGLYVRSPDVADQYKNPDALWAICGILLYCITRTVLITHRGNMHDDPLIFAVKDKTSQVSLGLILLCIAGSALL